MTESLDEFTLYAIGELFFQRESLVDEPLLTLSVQDVEIIKDAAELITLVSKRQSGISSEETTRLKWILKSLVEDFFHIQRITEKQETKGLSLLHTMTCILIEFQLTSFI